MLETYAILKDCWINGKLYKKSQLIKLTEHQAKEWLDRRCLKLNKANQEVQGRKQKAELINEH